VVTVIARLTPIFNSAQKRQHGKEPEVLFKKHREKNSVEKEFLISENKQKIYRIYSYKFIGVKT